jgi:hypothetical protein
VLLRLCDSDVCFVNSLLVARVLYTPAPTEAVGANYFYYELLTALLTKNYILALAWSLAPGEIGARGGAGALS